MGNYITIFAPLNRSIHVCTTKLLKTTYACFYLNLLCIPTANCREGRNP